LSPHFVGTLEVDLTTVVVLNNTQANEIIPDLMKIIYGLPIDSQDSNLCIALQTQAL